MTIWIVLQVVGSLLMVVLPFAVQARESWKPPMATPSLGTVGIVMMAVMYFFVAGLVNGGIVGERLGWAWYGTGAISLAAAGIGVVVSYRVLYSMAERGGKGLTVLGGVVLGVMVVVGIVGPGLF